MQTTIEKGARLRIVALVLIGAVLVGFVGFRGHAQTPRTPRRSLVDNERVSIVRLTFAAGQREQLHSNPTDVIVVQATPGEVEFAIGDEKTTGHQEPGQVWYIPKQPPHAFSNVGPAPLDIVVISLK
jgi:quercetin dioxygenase-like cupin family protein